MLMTKYVEGVSREQLTLIPEAFDDFITAKNRVRFMDVFVDKLDLKKLGFKYSQEVKTTKGRPSEKEYC